MIMKVELLLEHGLDPNLPLGDDQPYQLNYSPSVWAAKDEQWAVCKLLLDSGADENFQPAESGARTFWSILEEKGNEYQEAGNTPVAFEELLSHEKVIAKKKN